MSQFNLQDAILSAIGDYMTNIHTSIPGKIESYNPVLKKADIQPLVKRKFSTGETFSYPIISNVPVQIPGGKKACVSYPVDTGDAGILIFSERSMEEYLNGIVAEANQGDPRRFSLNDGIFIPGVFPFGEPGKTGDNINIELKNDKGIIHLNGFLKSVTLYEDLNFAMQAFILDLNTKLAAAFTAIGGVWPGISINISGSQSTQVKTGG